MPRHLSKFTGEGASEFSAYNRGKREWLLARGISPGDWSRVYPILKASWKAHGIPDRAEEVWRRLRVANFTSSSEKRR